MTTIQKINQNQSRNQNSQNQQNEQKKDDIKIKKTNLLKLKSINKKSVNFRTQIYESNIEMIFELNKKNIQNSIAERIKTTLYLSSKARDMSQKRKGFINSKSSQ